MSKKKVTIEEWNKDIFNKLGSKDLNKITKVIPIFQTWTTSLEEEEDEANEWQEISGIDLEFEDGSKLRIQPKSNKEDKELSLALDLVEYRPHSINWRHKE